MLALSLIFAGSSSLWAVVALGLFALGMALQFDMINTATTKVIMPGVVDLTKS